LAILDLVNPFADGIGLAQTPPVEPGRAGLDVNRAASENPFQRLLYDLDFGPVVEIDLVAVGGKDQPPSLEYPQQPLVDDERPALALVEKM
jgi:hypothetical protein